MSDSRLDFCVARRCEGASVRRHLRALALGLALSSLAAAAAADVPPIDACSNAGSSCNNAGPSGNQSGTCQSARCRRAFPMYDPNVDGGVYFVDTEYDCLLCVAGGEAGSSGASGGAGSSGLDSDGGSSCDCGLLRRPAEGSLALSMLGLGALVLAWSRRRQRP